MKIALQIDIPSGYLELEENMPAAPMVGDRFFISLPGPDGSTLASHDLVVNGRTWFFDEETRKWTLAVYVSEPWNEDDEPADHSSLSMDSLLRGDN